MWNATVDTVQIEVPRWLFRSMQLRPVNLIVSALTGVSISFCPLSLYELGTARVPFSDWRVLTNFAVIVLVACIYMSFGAPVLGRAWRRSTDDSVSAGDGTVRESGKNVLLFWFIVAIIGVVIWAISAK
jgi:hypothetical protein